jgi:hypothetical protein
MHLISKGSRSLLNNISLRLTVLLRQLNGAVRQPAAN